MPTATPTAARNVLNADQSRAVDATAGPVLVRAGPGTGKTRVVTHRIAAQVEEGVPAASILAVTFTDRAAREMSQRLRRLGVPAGGRGGVRAATFHSAALRQVGHFWPRCSGSSVDILPSKARLLAEPTRRHPLTRGLTLADLAGEIEWVKSHGPRGVGDPTAPDGLARLDLDGPAPRWELDVDRYAERLRTRDGPWPRDTDPDRAADALGRILASYEEAKAGEGLVDFDDVLAVAAALIRDVTEVAAAVRGHYTHLTVDEFQDVNRLQWDLLVSWVGDRDDVCVVGDPDQAIYGFTGASPGFLDAFVRRWPHAEVIPLRRNYRSHQPILDLAGRVLGSGERSLRGVRPDGPPPLLVEQPEDEVERSWVVHRCRELHEAGVAWSEMAILYRFNAQSEAWEAALGGEGIPYTLHDDPGFFARRHVRQALRVLVDADRQGLGTPDDDDPLVVLEGAVAAVPSLDRLVARILRTRMAWSEEPPSGDRARERWADLGVLVSLARERTEDDASATLGSLLTELQRRAALGESPGIGGVHLLTLHRAKGLEFDAVFVVGADEGRVPSRYAVAHDARLRRAGVAGVSAVAEERRLLYVGLTRAREHLHVSWSVSGRRKRSRFLGRGRAGTASREPATRPVRPAAEPPLEGGDLRLFETLREWRLERARADSVPAYVVLHDAALRDIARRRPGDPAALRRVKGVGPTKLERYADEVLALVAHHP
jgi:DNA helicase II / ATP-dependent DNA helicase PcrA